MMTHFLTALAHLLPVFLVAAVMFAGAALTLPPIGRWADRRVARAFDEAGVQYGPRIVYGPTCPIAADESVTRVLGWADPFKTTRRQIAALPTQEIAS